MKQLILTLLLISTFIVFGQKESKVVNIDNYSLEMIPNHYCFEDNNIHYFKYLKITDKLQFGKLETQGLGIVAYDNNLKEINSFDLFGTEKEERILETYFLKKTIILISYFQVKDEKIIKYYSYDLNGKITKETQLLSIGKKQNASIYLSQDSSKIGVLYTLDQDDKKANIKNFVSVIDYKGNLLWKKTEDTKFSSHTYDVKTAFLDNTGNFYQTTHAYDKKTKISTTNVLITNATTLKNIPVKSTSFLAKPKLFQIGDEIYYTGFEYNDKEEIYDNPFLSKITDTSISIEVNPQTIPSSLLEPLIKNKFYKKKDGWTNFMELKHGWKNEKGELRLAFDISYTSRETVGRITYNYHINNHTFIFSFGSDLFLKDIKVCPKETSYEVETLLYPVNSKVIGDDLYLIYNEHEHNINLKSIELFKTKGDKVPIVRRFSPDGKIKDTILIRSEKDSYVAANSSGFTNQNNVIFIAFERSLFKAKNIKLGIAEMK